jgi:hypothetical protein
MDKEMEYKSDMKKEILPFSVKEDGSSQALVAHTCNPSHLGG